jgi:imidazolonepropionase-like amidohydrolase
MVIANGQATYPVNGPTDPRHTVFAFTNARIYVDYKTIVDSATLIIRDGKILEVGQEIAIPKEAVIVDLAGKSIYPSLIDIHSDYGMPEIKRDGKGQDYNPQFLSNTKGAYSWNQAVRPEYDAYRNWSVDGKKAEELRKLGFGSVLSVNKDGIVRGTATMALLGNGKENDLIIKDRAAAEFSFDKGTSTQDYPSSLMGSIALIRQTFYDAQWYKNGGSRKEYNISLAAFNQLKDLPFIFDAGDKQNELRVYRIGEEFDVQFIVKGNGDEYERINEIEESGMRLIVPLNFPEAFDLSDPYDAINISLHELKHWELAPSNPAALEKSGIEFAITASGLKNKNDFWKNLRKAVEYGLSEQQALKSLTVAPAAFLNVQDKVGALKRGMIANFIITSGNLFSKETVILDNWVKGVRYPMGNPEQKDIRGNYSLITATGKATRIKIAGEVNAPELFMYDDTLQVKAAVFSTNGNLVTFALERKTDEPKGTVRYSGMMEEQGWSGNAQLADGNWVSWSMKFDSVYSAPAKKDTAVKVTREPGKVMYPNMAYGWNELPKASTVLIINATVWTNEAEGILKESDVLFSNGKIVQVGKDLVAPDGATVIDGTGKHVTAGIIDEHSHIAVSNSVNEGTQSSSAEVRIGDVLDADDINIYRQLAGGVTSSHLLHGSANAIGGQTQLIKLRWGQSPEELKFDGWPGYIKFALGENVKQSNWGDFQTVRFPQTRMGVEQVYVDYFTRAREYKQQQSKWTTADAATKANAAPPRKDLELDALSEILESKRFITCHSYVQSEINMLMHVADSFGFDVNTFTHILEGFKVADKMKAHGVRGASTFSDWWAYKYEVYEAIPYNAALLHDVGVNVGINSDDAEMARRLNQEAAKAVKYGNVSEEEAWKFVTLNPAKMLRVDDKVGSIKAGKDADLVLWNDHPMSIYAKPLTTYVDGIAYYDSERDVQLRDDIRLERARLIQLMNEVKWKGENVRKPAAKRQVLKHCNDEEYHTIH